LPFESWRDAHNSGRVSPCRCVERVSPRFLRQKFLPQRLGFRIWLLYRSSGGLRAGSRGDPSRVAWQSKSVSAGVCSAYEWLLL
jgi:hypothetical protein